MTEESAVLSSTGRLSTQRKEPFFFLNSAASDFATLMFPNEEKVAEPRSVRKMQVGLNQTDFPVLFVLSKFSNSLLRIYTDPSRKNLKS